MLLCCAYTTCIWISNKWSLEYFSVIHTIQHVRCRFELLSLILPSTSPRQFSLCQDNDLNFILFFISLFFASYKFIFCLHSIYNWRCLRFRLPIRFSHKQIITEHKRSKWKSSDEWHECGNIQCSRVRCTFFARLSVKVCDHWNWTGEQFVSLCTHFEFTQKHNEQTNKHKKKNLRAYCFKLN